MRVIDLHDFSLQEFPDLPPEPYAILSHTWETEEVTFRDWTDSAHGGRHLKGYGKIKGFCDIARERFRVRYGWVDTCCIDKSSSAELSEAINSMFRFYQRSAACVVYLADVSATHAAMGEPVDGRSTTEAVCRSRWFTRGWTLQEMLAPAKLVFYGSGWNDIGSLGACADATDRIAQRTGIATTVLRKTRPLSDCSIATRMSWASDRQTTRLEDEAYCLLGLFDINMPPLYGEGRKAFTRLQEEIVRRSTDHSIFAWQPQPSEQPRNDLLATSPRDFAYARHVNVTYRPLTEGRGPDSYDLTNVGLRICREIIQCEHPPFYHVMLNCNVDRVGTTSGSHFIALTVTTWDMRPVQARRSSTWDKEEDDPAVLFHRARIPPGQSSPTDICFCSHDRSIAYFPSDAPLSHSRHRHLTIARHARNREDEAA